jgi:hypothetical protein
MHSRSPEIHPGSEEGHAPELFQSFVRCYELQIERDDLDRAPLCLEEIKLALANQRSACLEEALGYLNSDLVNRLSFGSSEHCDAAIVGLWDRALNKRHQEVSVLGRYRELFDLDPY